MRDYDIIKIELIAIVRCVRSYTSQKRVAKICSELLQALDNNDKKIIIYCCEELLKWYKDNIGYIYTNEFVDDKDEHKKNIERLEQINNNLTSEESIVPSKKIKLENKNVIDVEEILNKIFEKFLVSTNQLLKRHDNRQTLVIGDEYDVQDYLHALLLLFFEDVRDEDYNQQVAGKATRVDFFLPKYGIIIETKYATEKLRDKEIANELILDIKRYSEKKNVKKIICFVFDPNYNISNPYGLENDLSNDRNVDVSVKIFPK